MTTQAYFQDIRKHIKIQLGQATTSIYVAVAWFTDRFLFDILCQKAKSGVQIQLLIMNDSITKSCSIVYNDLINAGGQLFLFDENFGTLMHNKFCVIDEKVIITGSYNWSIRASANHENITITSDAATLAVAFIEEFIRIKTTYGFKNNLRPLDIYATIKRLGIIKTLVELNDTNEINPHVIKLEEYIQPNEVQSIIEHLKKEEWEDSLFLISNYLLKSSSLKIYEDEEINKLKWLISYLELEFVALDNEKTNLLKEIADFVHIYTLRFGKILSRIMKLRMEKLEKLGNTGARAFRMAYDQFQEFKEKFDAEKERDKAYTNLTREQQDELKKKYFKAVKLCHPDAVANKYPNDPRKQEEAERLFKILGDAYVNNNLDTVSEILTNLENGFYGIEGITPKPLKKEELEKRIEVLNIKIERLRQEILITKNGADYKKISGIYDWDEFFKNEEIRLNNELNKILNEQ